MQYMASYSLKRFARIQIIKAITPRGLRKFLSPYAGYLARRGFDIGRIGDDLTDSDARDILSVLIHPDAGIPQSLVDALYHVDEMATQNGMELIVSEFRQAGYDLECCPPTPADVAVLAWITDSSLFEQVCAKQHHRSARTFRLYAGGPVNGLPEPLDESRTAAFEDELNDWSDAMMLGRHCKLFPFIDDHEHCYIVRRGQPFTRVSAIDGDKSSSIIFQPEAFDIVAYDVRMRQLRVASNSRATRDIYRRLAGKHLFGNEDHFSDRPLFSLLPLVRKGKDALVCDDVPGLAEVRLRKVQIADDASRKNTITWEGENIHEDPEFVRRCSRSAQVSRVLLGFRLVGAVRARSFEMRPPNVIVLPRDEDIVPIGQFLKFRGFITEGSAA
jgi:hypothetical protein